MANPTEPIPLQTITQLPADLRLVSQSHGFSNEYVTVLIQCAVLFANAGQQTPPYLLSSKMSLITPTLQSRTVIVSNLSKS